MPWGRIDDTLYDHPKVLSLPDKLRLPSIGLWVLAISWSNKHLADGRIPNGALRMLYGTPAMRAALITVGLFEEGGDHVVIHDYPEFNELKIDILERRRQAAEAGRMGGLAKRNAKRRAKQNGSEPLSEPLSVAPSEDVPTRARRPVPVPVPTTGPPPPPQETTRKNRPTSTAQILKDFDFRSDDSTRLTKAQLDAWSSFGSEWDRFKAAWFSKGLKWPPAGSPDDDPEAANPSQRALLYSILDSRPTDLPRWVREAPGKSAANIVGFVLQSWHAIRESVPADRTH